MGSTPTSGTSGQLAALDIQTKVNVVITSDGLASQAGLRFSADGRFLAYSTFMTGRKQVHLYDFQTGRNLLVSRKLNSDLVAELKKVARAAPDGYTMLIGNSGTHVFSQSLYTKPPFRKLSRPKNSIKSGLNTLSSTPMSASVSFGKRP